MRLLPAVALILLLGLLGAAPALADDLPPPVFPSGLPGPDDVPGGGSGSGSGGGTVKSTPGPTYVVTPGTGGTALPAPTTAPPSTPVKKAQVDDARHALDRLRQGSSSEVAGPTTATATAVSADDGTDWWLIGSGALLGLIMI
jgi:hypothetical protein